MEKTKAKKISIVLKKHGRDKKEKVWSTVSKQILKGRHDRPVVNVSKLSLLSKKFGEKTFVVAGKVLGSGEANGPLSVAALEFSGGARKKILEAKGKAFDLTEFLKSSPKKSSMVIVK